MSKSWPALLCRLQWRHNINIFEISILWAFRNAQRERIGNEYELHYHLAPTFSVLSKWPWFKASHFEQNYCTQKQRRTHFSSTLKLQLLLWKIINFWFVSAAGWWCGAASCAQCKRAFWFFMMDFFSGAEILPLLLCDFKKIIVERNKLAGDR